MTTTQQCVSCGKFMKFEPGASWAQNWHYEMDGSPTLDYLVWQCMDCTTEYDVLDTNCAYPERYRGVI